MNQHTDFKINDVVRHISTGTLYEVLEVDKNGQLAFRGYEYQKATHNPENYEIYHRPERPSVAKWKIESDGTVTQLWINGELQRVMRVYFEHDVIGPAILKVTLVGELASNRV